MFILDSTANHEVIALCQANGKPLLDLVFYLTRTWAYSIHRQKMILLGRWPEITTSKKKKEDKRLTNTLTEPEDYPIIKSNTNVSSFTGSLPAAQCLIYDRNTEATNFLVPAQ